MKPMSRTQRVGQVEVFVDKDHRVLGWYNGKPFRFDQASQVWKKIDSDKQARSTKAGLKTRWCDFGPVA